MKFFYLFIVIILLTFQGCATKEAAVELNSQELKTVTTPLDTHTESTPYENKAENHIAEFEEEFSSQESNDTIDPLSGYNRVMTSFNDKVIIYGLTPVSKIYTAILPQPLRLGISNFVDNIQFPIRFTNNLLQGKFQNSADELGRFLVNSTIGLGGLMDPAKHHTDLKPHEEDFGQTLGYYGIGSGFHVVLPFIGPSNVRDIVGITADGFLSPLINVRGLENYKIPDNLEQTIGIYAVHLINKTSLHLGEYEDLKKDAVDLYPFLRDIYEQKRDSEISE